ncbi:MAG: carboxypeptidase regulatory-like domain-containing protein [Acidobacteria bacterium]|nr:carboxypeptidase regulatory-like domain-containing protein [Acidobacteriota bacterium]
MYRSRLHRNLTRSIFAILLSFPLIFFSTGPASGQGGGRRLPASASGINATVDVVRDFSLADGYVISGTVVSNAGPVFAGTVTATSATESFSGPIMFNPFAGGSTYRLVARAGVYALSVQMFVLDQAGEGQVTITIDVATNFSVMSDRVFNITANTPPLFAVSGNVMNAGTLPNQGTVQFSTPDGRTSASAQMTTSYNLSVPAGTYNVSTVITINNGSANLFLYQSTVTIAGPTTQNILLPVVFNVSGTLKNSTGGPLAPSSFTAGDATRTPPAATFGFAQVPSNSATGSYALPLPGGSYVPTTNMTVGPGGNAQGNLSFTSTPSPFAVSGPTTYNVVAPATPPLRRISGKVTGAGGVPVVNAGVSAFSSSITGIPNATFSAGTTTGADGSYALMVASGTNYTLNVTPSNL